MYPSLGQVESLDKEGIPESWWIRCLPWSALQEWGCMEPHGKTSASVGQSPQANHGCTEPIGWPSKSICLHTHPETLTSCGSSQMQQLELTSIHPSPALEVSHLKWVLQDSNCGAGQAGFFCRSQMRKLSLPFVLPVAIGLDVIHGGFLESITPWDFHSGAT